jgi:hypothetical protein
VWDGATHAANAVHTDSTSHAGSTPCIDLCSYALWLSEREPQARALAPVSLEPRTHAHTDFTAALITVLWPPGIVSGAVCVCVQIRIPDTTSQWGCKRSRPRHCTDMRAACKIILCLHSEGLWFTVVSPSSEMPG